MNNSMAAHSEQYRQQKAQQRLENIEIGYSPQNLNPVNIEIGPGGTSRINLVEEEKDINDVQINTNIVAKNK